LAPRVKPRRRQNEFDSRLLEGIDGVIPLSLFGGFLIRLDMPRRTLDLDPYPAQAPVRDGGTYSLARADHNLLFLEGAINESEAGYVLLDPGAARNAVSPAPEQTPGAAIESCLPI
jgi:hypothetical protein